MSTVSDDTECPVGCKGCTLACPRLTKVRLRGGPWDGEAYLITCAQSVVTVPHDREGRLRGNGTNYLPTVWRHEGRPVWEVEQES